MPDTPHTSYVQRITRFDKKSRVRWSGVDQHFTFAYMGNSDFEFGSLPRTIKMMQADRGVALGIAPWAPHELVLAVGNKIYHFWYVGPLGHGPLRALNFIRDQLEATKKIPTAEPTRMRQAVDKPGSMGAPIGWLMLPEAAVTAATGEVPEGGFRPYALFLEQDAAVAWLKALGVGGTL